MKKVFSAVRFHFAPAKAPKERTCSLRNRQFRHLLVETLEGRRLMAANPVAQNDAGYFTPVNTDLVIGTSSVHLLANDVDIDSTSYAPSLDTSPSFGKRLPFGTNGSFACRPKTGFWAIKTLFKYFRSNSTLRRSLAAIHWGCRKPFHDPKCRRCILNFSNCDKNFSTIWLLRYVCYPAVYFSISCLTVLSHEPVIVDYAGETALEVSVGKFQLGKSEIREILINCDENLSKNFESTKSSCGCMKVEKRHVEIGSKNEISLVLTITPRSFGKFGQAVHLLDRKGNELFSLGIEGQALEPIAIDEIDRSACEAGKTFKAEVSSNFGHDLRGAKVKTGAMSPFEVDLITGDNGRFYLVGRCKDPLHAFPADGGSFEVDVKFQSGDELTSYLRVKRRLEEMILPNRLRSTTDEQSVVIVTSKSQMPDYGENIAIFDAAGTEIGAGTFSKRRSNVIYYKLKLHQERTNPTSNLVVSLSTTIGWENVGFVSVE